MIKNFFRIAVRNISRHKGFTFINVTGLAIGLAASLLILLWVQDEFSYEKFNLNGENIYRVEEDQFYSGARYHVTVTPVPGGPVWKEKIPEVKDQIRINLWLPRVLFKYEDNVFFKSSVAAVDSELLKYFTILAIIIACLGLYGLSSHSAERRTNEVGIRKVMGAGSFTVMYTLAREFLFPVLISILIAIPLGWIIVSNLLKQFAYRIEISIPVFIIIALGTIIIAMLTVSFQAYKASGTNPAKALKVE